MEGLSHILKVVTPIRVYLQALSTPPIYRAVRFLASALAPLSDLLSQVPRGSVVIFCDYSKFPGQPHGFIPFDIVERPLEEGLFLRGQYENTARFISDLFPGTATPTSGSIEAGGWTLRDYQKESMRHNLMMTISPIRLASKTSEERLRQARNRFRRSKGEVEKTKRFFFFEVKPNSYCELPNPAVKPDRVRAVTVNPTASARRDELSLYTREGEINGRLIAHT